MKLTRRGFLHGALCSVLASDLLAGTSASERVLVLVQLTGGNDGLNTVIPWSSSLYHNKRPTIRVPENEVAKIDDRVGFHPGLLRLKRLYDEGGLAVIQGAGYPNPIRSHFRSMDVWHTGRRAGRASGQGWISRTCATAFPGDSKPELVVHVGERLPYSLRSATQPPVTLGSTARYRWLAEDSTVAALRAQANSTRAVTGSRSARLERLRGVLLDAGSSSERVRAAVASYEPKVNYPRSGFGRSLAVAAAMISANLGSRVLSVELGNFDTHGDQRRTHDGLLQALDGGLGAFQADMKLQGLLDRVVVLVFSEFGRRVKENASRGTDHGTAGPMFLLGGGVRGGLHGVAPAMVDLEEFDLEFTTDFRSVYAAVIQNCFGIEAEQVLGQSYPEMPLFTRR